MHDHLDAAGFVPAGPGSRAQDPAGAIDADSADLDAAAPVDELPVGADADGERAGAGAAGHAGVADPATAEGVDVGVLDAIEQDLADVERALALLDEGTYGRCEVCGNTLDDDQLEHVPTARFCRDHLPLPLS